jgi:energy-coupling factor transport system permease protein
VSPLRAQADIDRPWINPLAQAGGLLILSLPVFLSFDLLTPVLALAFALPTVVLLLRPRLRSWLPLVFPLLLIAAGAGITNLLFAVAPGATRTHWVWGPIRITDFSISRAMAISARTMSLTLITTLTAVAMSPLALVRALMQNLGLSPRWGFSLYAGLNVLPGLLDDLATLKHTRMIRLAGRRQSLADALSLPVILLSGAIRRAERISISMTVRELEEARGRTFLVPSPWLRRDVLYLSLCALLAAATLAIAIALGSFRFNLG